jgi:hypothetical protein
MYLNKIAAVIRSHLPPESLPEGDSDALLVMYAVLARAKGEEVTCSDVHDAWSAWMAGRTPDHISLVEYDKLSTEVQREDGVFVEAIRRSSKEMKIGIESHPTFVETLFPLGPPKDSADSAQALDLYKIMVQSSEGLVGRRLGVNTFFLTMNGALLTGSGIVIQNSGANTVGALGIAILSLAGIILCAAWRSLIVSFGQLNRGKFQVINAMERHLMAAIYAAEWEALGRGENPKIYRSFTSREIWVPNALFALHLIAFCTAIAVYLGWFHIR